MKYFYDSRSDSLYLTLAERPYADSIEAAPGIVLDFDPKGLLIGIDFERASRTVDVRDLALHELPAAADADAARLDGAALKNEREVLALSQAELGRKLSVSSNTIARWERGELRIEHPAMLQLALAALRDQSSRDGRRAGSRPVAARSKHQSAEKRVIRSTDAVRSHANKTVTRRSSEHAKKR
jgi:uncharacterized protein YuzE/transcriptional regulator with XRE-family HTH domain